ncbi:MAG TPA: DUF6758 family protein [Nocardioides sp.]|jgi:hypothetical protein|uniref:DUF6758 family protein n=1 Tax=Nocardioides sp. TaxID=35761 RepID=UPI002E34CE57|nr:DUF6758 family protein [Nocardioides sp.]HEX3929111.1 DUF6758 family protein [Nocardioides sp.]
MPLRTECPRCPTPLDAPSCPVHGPTPVLHRPQEASYDGFAEALRTAREFPTYLPWPMSPGWSVTDFAVVGSGDRDARATMTCSSGTSALDGPVDVFVVSEESGTGLGARCAGTPHLDPGSDIGVGPPVVRVRIGSQSVPLWPVSTADADGELDRSVVAGEAHGRWLWVVLRPASAMLLLRDEWILRDVSGIGPPLVEMSFGGPAPAW